MPSRQKQHNVLEAAGRLLGYAVQSLQAGWTSAVRRRCCSPVPASFPCPRSYGDYEAQFEAARQRALPVLRQLLESQGVDASGGEVGLSSSNGAVPAPPGLVPHSGVAAARQS